MSISKPPKKPTVENAKLEKFINAAPDSGLSQNVDADEMEMTQISLRLSKADLLKIDQAAAERRIPRASFIRQATFEFMK